jgi:hypothetical protein
MASSALYMSASLDGFIAGPNEPPGSGLGDDGDFNRQTIATKPGR